ncbi:hypothetical protein HPB51_015506 [Rhipicephalus microplus]|uniref:Uncharacterized protein n=1 Tax=Rhipicephalus microplus TaxID=6941 RepID=A0A9J6DGW8_RHIMP|nr:hypothetical protein HPB51_015506 [Rhipicephalus microplus]
MIVATEHRCLAERQPALLEHRVSQSACSRILLVRPHREQPPSPDRLKTETVQKNGAEPDVRPYRGLAFRLIDQQYVMAALERVVLHPTLLDEVARVIQVDKAELAVMARGRLRRTQCLDGFMQVVGVVKDRVVCHPVDDGRLQVDDLNEDCWRHVRQYLSTADVKCAAANVDNA